MTNLSLLYIPGYGGTATPSKKTDLLENYGTVTILDTKSIYTPHQYMESMDDVKGSFDCIVGTSLGGYWAHAFAKRMNVPFILLNPVIDPFSQLRDIATEQELDQYKTILPLTNDLNLPGLVVVSDNDPVIDSTRSKDIFEDTSLFFMIPSNDDHSLNDSVDIYKDMVKVFLTDLIHRVSL